MEVAEACMDDAGVQVTGIVAECPNGRRKPFESYPIWSNSGHRPFLPAALRSRI